MKSFWLILSILFVCSFSYIKCENITPKEIQTEIDDAQKQFEEAKKMFNPWYAGPLLTSSAHVAAPGTWNFQPYLYIIDNIPHISY